MFSAMYDFLSERMNPKPPPNVLITNEVPECFRNQFELLFNRIMSSSRNARGIDLEGIAEDFGYGKGYPISEYRGKDGFSVISGWLESLSDHDYLDFLDFLCSALYESQIKYFDEFEEDVNDSLKSNSMGYTMVNGQLIPLTEPKETEEIVAPALILLDKFELDDAEEYLRNAYDLFRDGKNEEAVVSADKALENVIESSLEKLRIEFEKRDKPVNKLRLLIKNSNMPEYMESSLESLVTIMTLPGTIRNNNGGHAQPKGMVTDDSLVKYEIDLVCSTVLFIVRNVYGDTLKNSENKLNINR